MATTTTTTTTSTSASSSSRDKDKKPTTVNCLSCFATLAVDHTGISCQQGHHMCSDCGRDWITPELLARQFPLKCPQCKSVELNMNIVERNIADPQILELFLEKAMVHAMELLPGEAWACCPSCRYREIRSSASPPMFIFCRYVQIVRGFGCVVRDSLCACCVWCVVLYVCVCCACFGCFMVDNF
eukprot:TRINITY_DN2755_c2_g1_i1.p1 TRINITY_DN2755_c2_g1~~TRINITY_DN2755_c2_g1_i1.p1  ORF type:complete len:193 (+),score=29.42 TRINITY_DN2755_c2_g1_i1:26-580(+)